MYKKYLYIILTIGILFIIGLFYLLSPVSDYKCPEPPRPANVNEKAKWCGGCDGGEWIYLIPDSNKFHFIVYNDYTGVVRIDGIFTPNKNDSISLNYDNWKEQVLYYMNDTDGTLKIIIQNSISISELTCQYPAFGGNDWEIIREKENLIH